MTMAQSPLSRLFVFFIAVTLTSLALMTSAASPRRASRLRTVLEDTKADGSIRSITTPPRTDDLFLTEPMEEYNDYEDTVDDELDEDDEGFDENGDVMSENNDIFDDDNPIDSEADGVDLEEEKSEDCQSDEFYNVVNRACQECSSCPVNQIIRHPCSARADTVCGPFYEFDKFLLSPTEGHGPDDENERETDEQHSKRCNHVHDEENAEVISKDQDMTSVTLTAAASQWRTLSFALITVLCVICGIVVFVGIYVCVGCRRVKQHKEYFRHPELLQVQTQEADAEPRYVETFFTSSRDRVRTSRHLPVYQQFYTGSHVFPFLTSSLKTEVTSPEDHEYFYINCPDDVVDGSGSS